VAHQPKTSSLDEKARKPSDDTAHDGQDENLNDDADAGSELFFHFSYLFVVDQAPPGALIDSKV
jgi:hypothetical protein